MKDRIQEDLVKLGVKKMNTLMNYIKIVFTDMREQVMSQSLSTVEILIHPLTVFQIGILFWDVV